MKNIGSKEKHGNFKGDIISISVAETEQDILKCYPIMKQLRTQLAQSEFVARVQRQKAELGYVLAFAHEEDQVKAVAGFRVSECLCDGKYLYIDDIVANEEDRSKGYGGQLFDWIVEHAKENGCMEIELDSGVQRFAAHRFYLRKRMKISSHHFSLDLKEL